jgi:hypothetical protein
MRLKEDFLSDSKALWICVLTLEVEEQLQMYSITLKKKIYSKSSKNIEKNPIVEK